MRSWSAGLDFEVIGSVDLAFQASVAELEWVFWQDYGDRPEECERLPGPQAAAEDLVYLFNDLGLLTYYADAVLVPLLPFYQQVATELGRAAMPREHIDEFLQLDEVELLSRLVPSGAGIDHDPAIMGDIHDWVTTSAETLLLLYGENDPWTAGRPRVDESLAALRDVHEIVVPGQSHGVQVVDLASEDKQRVCERLASWTGTDASVCLGNLEQSATQRGASRASIDGRRRSRRAARR